MLQRYNNGQDSNISMEADRLRHKIVELGGADVAREC